MASESGAVWAIDVGNNSLKALHLSAERGVVEVLGFENIQHGKILTGSGITESERDELIALSLRQFVTQNDLGGDDIVISVPGQNSFARFVNLPPVERKRIPEIIKFEAAQQIPFDINEVHWDWQLITDMGSAETKVGIFAVKNEVVNMVLEHFSIENLTVSYVQMSPMALYNYVLYDRDDLGASDDQAIVALDIGAENTDLVVCTRSTVWQRCIAMGGNAFTRAIANAFKLSFERAEKLKRTAAMSKYARQIFQAMRPVFADLASEIQRSLGFYSSSNPDTKLAKVIAFGGGTKMRGLLKYLRQTLQVPVERPDSFKKLAIGPGVSAAKFHENVSDFGVVYGLALQGLNLAKIECNLLPRSIARSMVWANKAKYFTAAACVLLLVSLMCLGRVFLDKASYEKNSNVRQNITRVIDDVRRARKKLKAARDNGLTSEATIEKAFGLFEYRDVIPRLLQTIVSTLPNADNNPDQKELYNAFASGDVEGVKKIARKERQQIFITGISVRFSSDIAAALLDEIDFGVRGGKGEKGEKDFGPDSEWEREMSAYGGSAKYEAARYIKPGEQGAEVEEKKPGFVVNIAGYSPDENIGALINPVDAKDDPKRWGVVTRLLHLDDIVDGNSPFELYEITNSKHYKYERGEVDLEDEDCPPGIGLAEVRPGIAESESTRRDDEEEILVDPMTREIISKVAELNEDGKKKIDKRTGKEVYQVNDRWFKLSLKFVWRDAPAKFTAEETTSARGRLRAGVYE